MTEMPAIQSFDAFEAEARTVIKPPFKSQFGATWFHEIGRQKPTRDWLIKNLILARAFGIMYGAPGCGKSFLTTDMCLHAAAMAAGLVPGDWFGYRCRPFGVVYVVAEGRDDFEIRLHAWRADHGMSDDAMLPFVFLPTSIDMRSSGADTVRLAQEVAGISELMRERCGVGVGLVVIDTVARALAGGNENASEVMGAFVINCAKLPDATGAAVLGIHHGGKEAGRGPRGHEALHGAADFEIEVTGATEDTPNLWTVRKLKAGPGGATHRFRLRQTPVGEDADGDPVTSCIVVDQRQTAAKANEQPKGWRVSDSQREFLQVLADTIDKKGVMPPADLPVPANVLMVASVADVRATYVERLEATEAGDADQIEDRLRQRWSRATKKLINDRVIGSKKPWLWFTGKQVERFRLRGVADASAPTHVMPDDAPFPDDVTSPQTDDAADEEIVT